MNISYKEKVDTHLAIALLLIVSLLMLKLLNPEFCPKFMKLSPQELLAVEQRKCQKKEITLYATQYAALPKALRRSKSLYEKRVCSKQPSNEKHRQSG